jgi:hypothetical protein
MAETTNTNHQNIDFHKIENAFVLFDNGGVEYRRNHNDELVIKICPFCEGDLSRPDNQFKLSLNLKSGLFNCFRCDNKGTYPKLVSALERRSECEINPTAKPHVVGESSDWVEKILSESQDANESPVNHYLHNRGLSGAVHGALFHPNLSYKDVASGLTSKHPAAIFPVKDVAGNLLGIQRIYITTDGKKANVATPKKALGKIMGGACHFGEPNEILNIAEGPETALAVFEGTGIPTWAAISAKGMEQIVVPKSVDEIHIWADLDRSGTGQISAEKLATKLAKMGKRAFIHTPQDTIPLNNKGIDWLDVFNQGKHKIRESFESTQEWKIPAFQSDESDVPKSVSQEALIGFVGELIRVLMPHTEADPMAVLIQFLVLFGNLIGRGPFYLVERTRHYLNLFIVIVGASSKARKGTSYDLIRYVLEGEAPDWVKKNIKSGLSTGEGIIHHVRDATEKEVTKKDADGNLITESKPDDPGVEDKRLTVIESEFASVLRVSAREGNTLSPVIRNAWDRGDLSTLSKNSPEHATNAHVSIIGHITGSELTSALSQNDMQNGLANRFLWAHVHRSKNLPYGGSLHDDEIRRLQDLLRPIAAFASKVERLHFNEEARTLWAKAYNELSKEKPGLFGAIISRAEAQVIRLSSLYAVLDKSTLIQPKHLRAALAVWEYCEESARYIFGEYLEDPTASAILVELRKASPKGLSRTEIRDIFSRKISSQRVSDALKILQDEKLARFHLEATGGAPTERWFAVYIEKQPKKGLTHLNALNAPKTEEENG